MASGDTEPAFWGGYHEGWDLSGEEGGTGHFSLFCGFHMCSSKHPNPGVSMKKEDFRVGCPLSAGLGEGLLASQVSQWVKSLPAMHETQETRVRSLGQEDALEESMGTHPSILAWRIPWTEEPAGLQRVGREEMTERACTHGEGPWRPWLCLGSHYLTGQHVPWEAGVTSWNCSEGSCVVLVSCFEGLGDDHLVPGAGLSWHRARALPCSAEQSQLDSHSQAPQCSRPQRGHHWESSPDLPLAKVVVLEGSAL